MKAYIYIVWGEKSFSISEMNYQRHPLPPTQILHTHSVTKFKTIQWIKIIIILDITIIINIINSK